MCVVANVSESFYMVHLAKIERFYTIPTFAFKYQILYAGNFAILSRRKSTQVREGVFSLGNE